MGPAYEASDTGPLRFAQAGRTGRAGAHHAAAAAGRPVPAALILAKRPRLLLLAAAIWGGAISALVTWWEGPNNALQLDAFDPGRFAQPNNINYINGVPASYLPAACAQVSRGAFTPPPSCTQALSHFRGFLTYQPADRYWTFQGIESGIFLALAAILIAVTAVVLLRRDA